MGVLSNYIVQIMYRPIVKFFNLHKFNWRFLHNDVRSRIVETSNNVTIKFFLLNALISKWPSELTLRSEKVNAVCNIQVLNNSTTDEPCASHYFNATAHVQNLP